MERHCTALNDRGQPCAQAPITGRHALLHLGMLWASKDYTRTGDYLEQASRLAQEIGDPAEIAHSMNRVANWLVNVERPAGGVIRHREALAIFESLGDTVAIAGTLDLLGMATCLAGDLVESIASYQQAISLLEQLDDGPSWLTSDSLCAAATP